jgi:hypothetical protein
MHTSGLTFTNHQSFCKQYVGSGVET